MPMLFKRYHIVQSWYKNNTPEVLLKRLHEDLENLADIKYANGCKLRGSNYTCIAHRLKVIQLLDRTLNFVRNLIYYDDNFNKAEKISNEPSKFKQCTPASTNETGSGSTGDKGLDKKLQNFCNNYRGEDAKTNRLIIELPNRAELTETTYDEYQCPR